MSMYSLLIEPILTEKSSKRGYTRSYKKAIIVLDGKEKIDIVK